MSSCGGTARACRAGAPSAEPGAAQRRRLILTKGLFGNASRHARLTKGADDTAAVTCLWESAAEVGVGEKISWMQPSEIQRALAAAMSTASALGLTVDDAIILHDSNKLAVRLLPCDVLDRVAPT